MKVLVTRTDRLGDLVVSLPALAWLRAARPDWQLHAMVAPGALPLVEKDPHLDGVWTWTPGRDGCDQHALERDLRAAGFDAAVLLVYDRGLAALLRRAGIPRRYGPWSRISSWFLLNRGVRQARSRRGRHEAEYNLELVQRLAGEDATPAPTPRLHLSDAQRRTGAGFRERLGRETDTVAFIHPGSGGSALDWEPDRFAAVANALAARPGWRVFVTGSGRDAAALDTVDHALDPTVGVLVDAFDLRDFIGVLGAGDVFVGPSTGPLHMAAALGLATVGVYPPAPAMAPARWGPRGPWCRTLVPEVDCPARHACTGTRCRLYCCLDRVAVADVMDVAVDLAARRGLDRAPGNGTLSEEGS